MKNIFYAILIIFFSQCKPKVDDTITQFPGKPEVPLSIKKSHVSLLNQINKMSLYEDSSGRVALKIEEFMQHHFNEEEDFILPTLGLLPLLANGQLPEQSKDIVHLSEKAKSQMNHMSAEHQLIKEYIKELKLASDNDKLPEIIKFENDVLEHALSEEEVFFPTAILIGEYLKLKTATKK